MSQRYTSVSSERLLNYADTVLAHDALEEVLIRVHNRMLARFRTGTPAEREQINAIMDADQAFFEELKKIQAELTNLDEENN